MFEDEFALIACEAALESLANVPEHMRSDRDRLCALSLGVAALGLERHTDAKRSRLKPAGKIWGSNLLAWTWKALARLRRSPTSK